MEENLWSKEKRKVSWSEIEHVKTRVRCEAARVTDSKCWTWGQPSAVMEST